MHDLSILYSQNYNITFAFKYGLEADEMAQELYDSIKKKKSTTPTSLSEEELEEKLSIEFIVLQSSNNLSNLYLLSENYEKCIESAIFASTLEVTETVPNLLQQFSAYLV